MHQSVVALIILTLTTEKMPKFANYFCGQGCTAVQALPNFVDNWENAQPS